jgi:hypothetical protein
MLNLKEMSYCQMSRNPSALRPGGKNKSLYQCLVLILLMRKLIVMFCLYAAFPNARAQELNITFAEWVGFGQIPRAVYLAGVLDHVHYLEDENAIKWAKCLSATKRTLVQMSDDLAEFPERSQRAYGSVPDALRDYLLELCPHNISIR